MMILPHTHKQKEEEGKCKSGAWTTLKPYINILKSKNWNEQENWYEWWYVLKKSYKEKKANSRETVSLCSPNAKNIVEMSLLYIKFCFVKLWLFNNS